MSDIIRRAFSIRVDAEEAVEELADGLKGPGLNAVVFFCDPSYDLDALGRAMKRNFECPVIGCTTAGEILAPSGYMKKSLVGVGFASTDIFMNPVFIPGLGDFVKRPDPSLISFPVFDNPASRFSLLLIDGLSMLEERTVAVIQAQLRGVPLIGGSAGDGLRFLRTGVYYEGKFHSDAAVLALFTTGLPFKTFQIQHFLPTETKLVITEADVSTRTVMEINGLPAAAEYARIVGASADGLSDHVFAAHPLMLRVGGKYYVRAIQKVNKDGGLTFYCAIDNGLVLTLGKAADLLDNLKRNLEEISRELPGLHLVLGCDCLLRRIELEQNDGLEKARSILEEYPFIGFSTYGEQYGGIHISQTLTGIAIGAADE